MKLDLMQEFDLTFAYWFGAFGASTIRYTELHKSNSPSVKSCTKVHFGKILYGDIIIFSKKFTFKNCF